MRTPWRLAFLPAWSGGLLGQPPGLVASGGKDAVTGIQINGAKARAKAETKDNPSADAAPADEWVNATLDDLARG